MRKAGPFLLLITSMLLVLLPLSPGIGSAQVGTLTLGVVLNQLLNKVGGLITAAQNAGSILEVGAGGQIATAIEAAKAGYEHELNITIDKLDAAQRRVLDDLTTKVGYMEQHAYEHLKEITQNGAIAVNIIPFSKTFPQVARYSPYYAVPSISDDILFTAEGNFFDSPNNGYEPQLEINGSKVPASIAQTTKLAFRLAPSLFSTPNAHTAFAPVTLTVPYRESCWLFFHCKEEASFKFLMSVVPARPGRLTFTTSATVPAVETSQKTSGLKRQDSSSDDIPDPRANGFQHCEPPDAGWRVRTNTVELVTEHSEGEVINNGNTSNLANACWNITTVKHGLGTSGKINFRIRFTQEHDKQRVDEKQEVVDLTWGGSKVFNVPSGGTWQAHFDQFDGRGFDINTTTFSNPYLHVGTSGNTVNFTTIP